jgi:hypothetical protein
VACRSRSESKDRRLIRYARWCQKQAFAHNRSISNSPTGRSAFHLACSNGALPLARWLVGLGLSANAATSDGVSAVHFAALGGHLELLQWLADRDGAGASLGALTTAGMTALHCACLKGHTCVGRVVLDHWISCFDNSTTTLLSAATIPFLLCSFRPPLCCVVHLASPLQKLPLTAFFAFSRPTLQRVCGLARESLRFGRRCPRLQEAHAAAPRSLRPPRRDGAVALGGGCERKGDRR